MALLASTAFAEEWTYWIDPCTPQAGRANGCKQDDPDLAKWALGAWARESAGGLTFKASSSEAHARLRIRWGSGRSSLYGEARPIMVDGLRGAEIFVQSDTAARTEPMLRDAIVYLTCLHESGHALGLNHTQAFADIMYSFQFGGDIDEYFGRYRRKLKTREDIRQNSGMSEADKVALRQSTRIPVN